MSDWMGVVVEGQSKLFQELDEIPEGLEDAGLRAVNAAARWGAAQAARRIAKAHRLPFKVVRDKKSDHNRIDYRLAKRSGRGGKLKNSRTGAFQNQNTAYVWIGRNPIKAAYLGDLFQSAKGAGAGEYYWKGSFRAEVRAGQDGVHDSVWYRLGKGRHPIKERRVELTEAPAIAEQINAELPKKLLDLFEREVAK